MIKKSDFKQSVAWLDYRFHVRKEYSGYNTIICTDLLDNAFITVKFGGIIWTKVMEHPWSKLKLCYISILGGSYSTLSTKI